MTKFRKLTKRQSTSCYIIAEAGVNHNGSVEMAKKLIEVAAEAGADAVKFQTFKADKLVCRSAPKAEYQTRTTDATESQFEMLCKLELNEAAHKILIDHCRECKIEFLSSPFDEESVELLMGIFQLPRIKVSSGEITNAPLLLKVAQTRKPVILSTGMSTLGEIEDALGVLSFGYLGHSNPSIAAFRADYFSKKGQALLKDMVTLLHCTTEYPAPFADVNLKAMDTMRIAFGLPVGFSDHTEGIAVAIGAVARGATIIEKHFTLDRTLPGPDHKASLEPAALKAMVQAIREIEQSLGTNLKRPSSSEYNNMGITRKSLVAANAIAAGDKFTAENLSAKRPGSGLSPMHYWDMLGQVTRKDYVRDEVITP